MFSTKLAVPAGTFLIPNIEFHESAKAQVKHHLDALAADLGHRQSQQHYASRSRKRKRGHADRPNEQPVLLGRIYNEGFNIEQIFEQSKAIIKAAGVEIDKLLEEGAKSGSQATNGTIDRRREGAHNKTVVTSITSGNGKGSDLDSDLDVEEELEEDSDLLSQSGEIEEEMDIEEDEDSEGDSPVLAKEETFIADPNGLNDGFFSIDDFNKQAQFLEQQDSQQNAMDNVLSDEEEVDWDADPLANGRLPNAKGVPVLPNGVEDLEGESEEENEEEEEDADDLVNTNNIFYKEFFDPPPKKVGKNKKNSRNMPIRPQKPKDASTKSALGEEDENENDQRTMSVVQRDLFGLEDGEADTADGQNILDARNGGLSTHELQQTQLAKKIRQLEAANVAKRDWTLQGEARAADRPINSLLEEDLDFERTGKPVPVITQEISDSIEALIQRRIIDQEFDEIIRRRPDDLITGPKTRRGQVEIDGKREHAGLAEEYEQDYLRKNDPNFVEPRDQKLKKEYTEIEALWKECAAKLDALSNWHFTPRAAVPSLDIRTDAPAITLEDARPTAGGEAATNLLAPQEIYAPGAAKVSGEITTRGGIPLSKQELSQEQKHARRQRRKEKARKAVETHGRQRPSTAQSQQNEVVKDLAKGGVRVIGKKGELTDVNGEVSYPRSAEHGAVFKL